MTQQLIEALREIHMECLDEGHTDSGEMGDPCGQRGQVIRCGICVALDSVRKALAATKDATSGIASTAASSAQKENSTSSPVLADEHDLVYSSELGYVLKAEAPVETVDQLRAAVIELSNRHIPQHRIREALDRLILAAEARGRQQGK